MTELPERQVADELAIRELVARYCDAVVRRDEDAWRATWAEDAEWDLAGQVMQGRDTIVKAWVEMMERFGFSMLQPVSAIIEIDGDHAKARWYTNEYGHTPDGQGSLVLGVYHDRYRKQEGRWSFTRRRFDMIYVGPPDMSAPPIPFPEHAD